MGKATHDPHRVLEGEMLKGNQVRNDVESCSLARLLIFSASPQVHISSGAPSTGLMNAQR